MLGLGEVASLNFIKKKINNIEKSRIQFLCSDNNLKKFKLLIEKIINSDQELKYEFINYLSIIKEEEISLYDKDFKKIRDYYRSRVGVSYPKYGTKIDGLYEWSQVIEQLINIINNTKEYDEYKINNIYSSIIRNESLVNKIMKFPISLEKQEQKQKRKQKQKQEQKQEEEPKELLEILFQNIRE